MIVRVSVFLRRTHCDDNLSVRVNCEWSGHVRSPWFCSPYQTSLNSCVQTIYSVSISSAPGAPGRPSYNIITPNGSHGPRLNLQWSRPQKENGIIRNYTLFYSHSEDPQRVHTETFRADTFSYSVGVLGGVTYDFYICQNCHCQTRDKRLVACGHTRIR